MRIDTDAKRFSLSALAILFIFCASGQVDTSNLKMGNLSLSPIFTQHQTISGEDLQRLPFSSLDEAINVYFYGIYTTPKNIVYVIDGNFGADVNAYNIHDIQSVTLVTDARTLMNGITSGKQLIVVTTKTGFTHHSAVNIAASEYIVRDDNLSSFHNLYASAVHSKNKIEIGGSVAYVHEVFPIVEPAIGPASSRNELNRFTINAWFIAAIAKSTTLTLRMNFSPADSLGNHSYPSAIGTDNANTKGKVSQTYPSINLYTIISKKWYNSLDGGWRYTIDKWNYRMVGKMDTIITDATVGNVKKKARDIFVRDELGFRYTSGNWTIHPTLNIFGQLVKSDIQEVFLSNQNGNFSASSSSQLIKGQRLYLTPAFEISHTNIFNLQIGSQYRWLEKYNFATYKRKLYPFGALAIDALRLLSPSAPSSLMLHVSHSIAKSDLATVIIMPQSFYRYSNGFLDSVFIPGYVYTPDKPYHNTTAGATLSLLQDRITLMYTYENNSYYVNVLQAGSGYFLTRSEAQVKLSTHRFVAEYHSSSASTLQYKGVFSVYHMHSLFNYPDAVNMPPTNFEGNYPNRGWSGGQVNQFSFKQFIAGISMLYYFDQQYSWPERDRNGILQLVLHHSNSLVVQNIYGGYKLANKELYFSLRNLFGTENYFDNGMRKYIGAGIKVQF